MSRGAYEATGVDYDVLDAAKRRALAAAATTLGLPAARGASVLDGLARRTGDACSRSGASRSLSFSSASARSR